MNKIDEIFSSVVMPVHNGEQFLREAIDSVLNQSYKNFELLIIENCSTDSSVEIIKSYNDLRIRLIIEKNCGQVQAYNSGFKEAKGEYVFIHDHDDVSHPQRFEKQLKCIIDKNIDICGSLMNLIDNNNEIIGKTDIPKEDSEISEMIIYNCAVIHNSSVCISKSVFENIGLWNIKYYPLADVEFYLRANIQKYKFYNIPEYLYLWRRHNKQLSSKLKKNSRIKLKHLELEYLLNLKEKIKKNEYYYYKSLIYYYTDHLLYSLFYNITSFIYGKFDKNTLRYFILLIVFGFPLKIFRRFNLLNSQLFLISKTKFDKIFNK